MKNPEPNSPVATNPLLQHWTAPYGLPPFSQVRPEHFAPGLGIAMKAQLAEIDAIAANPQPPSFENTVAALDRSGRLFMRIELLFSNLTISETNPQLQAVQRELACLRGRDPLVEPMLAKRGLVAPGVAPPH